MNTKALNLTTKVAAGVLIAGTIVGAMAPAVMAAESEAWCKQEDLDIEGAEEALELGIINLDDMEICDLDAE